MLVSKEITILRLTEFTPPGYSDEQWLAQLEETRPTVVLCKDATNEYDANCMLATLNKKPIGKVSQECQRYLDQLLDEFDKGAVAQFVSLRREAGHAPVLKVSVIIDPMKVTQCKAGELWDDWQYSGPCLGYVGIQPSASFFSSQLKETILQNSNVTEEELADQIDTLEYALLFDVSINTVEDIDDLCFFLETLRTENADRLRAAIEHAVVKRRSETVRKEFAEKYWPEYLDSENSNRLWNMYERQHLQDARGPKKVANEALKKVEAELKAMPYDLGKYKDDISRLRMMVFYKKITARKLLELMSALVFRARLKRYIKEGVKPKDGTININHYHAPGSLHVGEIKSVGSMENPTEE